MLFVLERISGILGVLGASLLEIGLVPSFYSYLAVGFIEEFIKGVL